MRFNNETENCKRENFQRSYLTILKNFHGFLLLLLLLPLALPGPPRQVGGSFVKKGVDTAKLLPIEVLYSWKELNFDFDLSSNSSLSREQMIKRGMFIPENNIITGVKVDGGRLFISVARWKSGIPATLSWLPYPEPTFGLGSNPPTREARLVPYPSWEMNQVGDCKAIQYAHGMEIDQYSRMWVADVGRIKFFEATPDNSCPPKLIIIDLVTHKVIRVHEFPETVVSRTTSYLDDVVVACPTPEDCTAYITDTADAHIVVYNYKENRSWFALHSSMLADPAAETLTILGKPYQAMMGVNGIVLSPKSTNFSRLFYSPLSSYELFSVETKHLYKHLGQGSGTATGSAAGPFSNVIALTNSTVMNCGRKTSQTDGMAMDQNGVLYFGQLGNNAVHSWQSMAESTNLSTNQTVLLQDDTELQWPDAFAFDNRGYVLLTTNKIHRYISDSMDFSATNFRIVRFYVGAKSYMY